MNYVRSARQVASATRTLSTLPCRTRYPRPQNWPSTARFYRDSQNHVPRVQRVIFHRPPLLTWWKFGKFVLYAAIPVFGFEYLSYGLDLLVEEYRQDEEDEDDDYEFVEDVEDDEELEGDEGSEAPEEDEEDEEIDLEGSIYILGFPFGSFLPLPWTRRQLPRDPYAPDDEILALWEDFRKHKESVQQYKQQISEEIIAAAAERYRTTNVKQVGGWISEPQLPAAPPREYDQLGLVLFDGFPHLERRPAPPLTLFKDAIQALAIAAGASCSFVIKTKTNEVRQLFGWPPLIIKETEVVDHYNKMLQHLRKLQEQQARAASKKNAALEKAGDKNGEDSVVPAKSAPQADFKTFKWSARHAFVHAFVRELAKRLNQSSDIPRDCFAVVGTVNIQIPREGGPRTLLHDFNGVYNLRKRRFVEFYVRRKSFRPV
ncbi:uncharacterized protein J3D65DRAFT_262940 [Phyllosticta citribraziliensis]|uniref:Uncharacterized protein n=1 Tax=Phyllosticta citribraziliensis TaxID=989973 RepID=A0ABR1M0M0_9PEZI